MTTKILEPPSDSQALVRTAAFRLLLASSEAIGLEELAAHSGIRHEWISELLDQLDGAGRIRRGASGKIVGPFRAGSSGDEQRGSVPTGRRAHELLRERL